jgi:hypothetical protein
VKRSELTTDDARNYLFSAPDSGGHCSFYFSADKLRQNPYTAANGSFTTDAVFRDPSAWYHIVYAYDSTQSTATDRIKLYVNGVLQTFSAYSAPTENQDSPFSAAAAHYIGKHATASTYSNFYLADVHFVDGQTLAPTDFGEFDDNNVWQPKEFSGTYGTNGFHLDFSDNSSNAALGYDAAGSNDWTVNNIVAASKNYANYVYAGGATYSATETGKAFYTGDGDDLFDGTTNNYVGGENVSGGTLYFRPATAITGVTSIELYGAYGGETRVNGSVVTVSPSWSTSDQYVSVQNPPSTITEISVKGDTGVAARLKAIKVNGAMLVDSPAKDVDSLVDTPTNYGDDTGAGGEVRGNYATFNPLLNLISTSGALTNGNLRLEANSTGFINSKSSIPASVYNCYCEVNVTNGGGLRGIGVGDVEAQISSGFGSYVTYRQNGDVIEYPGNITLGTVASYTTGDLLGMAINSTQILFYKNGTLVGTYSHGLTGTYFVIGMTYYYGSAAVLDYNFGQRPFAYPAPSGYKALCTQNLPEPTIADGSDYFDTKLWTGDGTTSRAITGLSFSPDLLWIKSRSSAGWHALADSVRGDGKILASNATNSEYNNSDSQTAIESFDSNGFTIGHQSGWVVNSSSTTIVGWAWDAGANSSKTYAVTVVSDGGNKYRLDGFGTSAVTLDLEEGSTYTFDQSDSSNAGHPLRFSTTSDGTHGAGSEYTTGVTATGTPGSAGASTTIVVASGAPTLYYYCSVHSGMGGQLNTNSTAGATVLSGSLNDDVYDQSQTWSGLWTGTTGYGSFTNLHDADDDDFAQSLSATLTFPSAISLTSLRIQHSSTFGTATLSVNGTDVTSQLATSGTKPYSTITGFSSLTSIAVTGSDYQSNVHTLYNIEVNGRKLIDSGVSVTAVPSINSVVRANPAAGFSIVSVTEAAASGGSTVGHGLNTKPQMIIEKSRTGSTPWYIHHSGLGDMSGSFLRFDTSAKGVDNAWNLVEPTSTTFGIDPTYVLGDANADVIYYLFAPVEGYSSMGSYTGNGSANGPFVYTGFRPAFLLRKRTDSAGVGWYLIDTARDTYNESDAFLDASDADAEIAGTDVDILSNGFKLRNPDAGTNASNGTYIYACFAENPLKTARAR